jgi:hypothetical protein
MGERYGEGVMRCDKALSHMIKQARRVQDKYNLTDTALTLVLERLLKAEESGSMRGCIPTSKALRQTQEDGHE